jgi:hypothetical protein
MNEDFDHFAFLLGNSPSIQIVKWAIGGLKSPVNAIGRFRAYLTFQKINPIVILHPHFTIDKLTQG